MADLNTLETVRTKLMARINQLDGQLKELRVKLHTIDGAWVFRKADRKMVTT